MADRGWNMDGMNLPICGNPRHPRGPVRSLFLQILYEQVRNLLHENSEPRMMPMVADDGQIGKNAGK
jgi:hypothetical protein